MAMFKASRFSVVTVCCALLALLTGGCTNNETTGSAQEAGQQSITKCKGEFCAPDSCGEEYFKVQEEIADLEKERASPQAELACKSGVARHDCDAPGEKGGFSSENPNFVRELQEKSGELPGLEKEYRQCCAKMGGDPDLGFEGHAEAVVITLHGTTKLGYLQSTSVIFEVKKLSFRGCFHDSLWVELEDNGLSQDGIGVSLQQLEAGGSMDVRKGSKTRGSVELSINAHVYVKLLENLAGEDLIHFSVSNALAADEDKLFGNKKDPLTTTLYLTDQVEGTDGKAIQEYGLDKLQVSVQIQGLDDPRL